MSDRVVILAAETEEALRELPMPAIVYFAITFGLFLVALAVTWSFRNTAYKVQPPRAHDEHGASGSGPPAGGSPH